MATGDFRRELRQSTPALTSELDALAAEWLKPLIDRLRSGRFINEARPKQINDPVWGTIELLPWEVALLDTPLLQRMRGVKQLGLAPLVFPSASHDRLEHILGVVGAAERVLSALGQQIERWNLDNKTKSLPLIAPRDRYALRLAALLHDIGHGPFSHALEPILEPQSVLLLLEHNDGVDWRRDLKTAQSKFVQGYSLNKPPAPGEVIAALLIISDPMTEVLGHDRLFTERGRPVDELLEIMVAAVVGGISGPGASFISAILSSEIDADKLDYLSRDAHHSGLEIGFDTDRLLSKLEILRVTEANVDGTAPELRVRAAQSPDQLFLQLGIAAAGFGSFEQMLIGRTFLYDRLYHHHKVRAAEAMAQRLMLVAERDRKRRFGLGEIFLRVSDDTMLRIFAGDITHQQLENGSPAAASLARGILDRELLHRAFAFRGRFIAVPPGMSRENIESHQQAMWPRITRELATLAQRYDVGLEIHALALQCARVLLSRNVDEDTMSAYIDALLAYGPEQIIVDLPELKAGAIRLLARYPNGALKVPEFSFNPYKWADAYEIQKRTGYVFCRREILPIVALASKIVFLTRFGVAMSEDADGYIKATQSIPPQWLPALAEADVVDVATVEQLTNRRYSLIRIRAPDLGMPTSWIVADTDAAVRLASDLNKHLKGGLLAEHLDALGKVLAALYAFVDNWYSGKRITSDLADEEALQELLLEHFRAHGLETEEGTKVGGGKLDLFVADAVLVENKFHGRASKPANIAPAAGMQGRRYAIALNSQLVIVLLAYRAKPGTIPDKVNSISIEPIASSDQNRVEIRISLPFGAVVPSDEKADSNAKKVS